MQRYTSSKGSTLAISLVILTSITLISITSLQRSGIQGRMVSSIQHKEKGFHAANGELEEIYQFYATQTSATQALSAPLNSFDIVAGEQDFLPVEAGHESAYNSYDSQQGGSHSQHPRLAVTSNIKHTGLRSSLVDGFSIGTFVEYGFIVSSQAAKPTIGTTLGKTLSSQLIGIKYIAPAG